MEHCRYRACINRVPVIRIYISSIAAGVVLTGGQIYTYFLSGERWIKIVPTECASFVTKKCMTQLLGNVVSGTKRGSDVGWVPKIVKPEIWTNCFRRCENLMENDRKVQIYTEEG